MYELKSITSVSHNVNDLSKPLAITYDNLLGKHDNSKLLIKSLQQNDWEYTVISINDIYRDHRDKLIGYKQFLETLHSDKIVILLDSRDVICCRNVNAFMDGYKSLNCDLIVSLEMFCNTTTNVVLTRSIACIPLIEYWKYRNVTEWPIRKYVNSGLIAGKAASILHFLNYALDNNFIDDQEALGSYMNTFPERIYGDQDATILHSTTFGKGAGLENSLIQKHDSPTFAEFFGRAAFFLHFPGLNAKGQALMYDFARLLFENGASGSRLNELYGVGHWDGINVHNHLIKSFCLCFENSFAITT